MARVFVYKIVSDDGGAPCVQRGLLTLAICKPMIRSSARVGDTIVAFAANSLDRRNRLVYAARVTSKATDGAYYKAGEYKDRRDCIYRWVGRTLVWRTDARYHQGGVGMASDIGLEWPYRRANVLMSKDFRYFGCSYAADHAGRFPPIAAMLASLRQGHRVNHSPRLEDELEVFLAEVWRYQSVRPIVEPRTECKGTCGPRRMRHAKPPLSGGADDDGFMTHQGRVPAIKNGATSIADTNQPRSEAREPFRRLVLSRKGFDSASGGMASPILEDGRMLALPIPSLGDPHRMRDLGIDELGPLFRDLKRDRLSLSTRVHIDPDLDVAARSRAQGWRPSLGQRGAAQTHLAECGVGAGDVFLFFGWFRRVENCNGRWRWVRDAPDLHVLFGWLEVAEVLSIGRDWRATIAARPWLADHPHVLVPRRRNTLNNTIYLARAESQLVPGQPGGGRFSSFHADLQLSAEGGPRSVWSLPGWFMPVKGRSALSYHASERWTRDGERCRLRSVARGQEFVLDLNGRPQAVEWVRNLVRRFGTT